MLLVNLVCYPNLVVLGHIQGALFWIGSSFFFLEGKGPDSKSGSLLAQSGMILFVAENILVSICVNNVSI